MRIFLTSIVLLGLITATLVGLSCTATVPGDGAVQVIAVPGGGRVPDAEIDATDTIHLVYLAGQNVYYVKSIDGGPTFSKPIRVNTEIDFASGGKYRGPDLALGKIRPDPRPLVQRGLSAKANERRVGGDVCTATSRRKRL